MLAAVTIAKIAGIASLLILGWVVFRMSRSRPETEPEEQAQVGPKKDATGDLLMRGFTAMLLIGVTSALAISVGEVVQAM